MVIPQPVHAVANLRTFLLGSTSTSGTSMEIGVSGVITEKIRGQSVRRHQQLFSMVVWIRAQAGVWS